MKLKYKKVFGWLFPFFLLVVGGIFLFISTPVVAAGKGIQPAAVEVGKRALTVADVHDYVRNRPAAMATPETFMTAVDTLVDSELLYQKAIAEGLDQDPATRQVIRQLLVQSLIEKKINRPTMERPVSEAEIRCYYDEHKNLYERPEQIRLAEIFIAGKSPDMRQKAKQVLVEALNAKERFSFSRLISKYSGSNNRQAQGDTGFFDRQGKPGNIAHELVKVGFTLANGSIAPQVIETGEGFYIVKLVGKRQAFKTDLAKVSRDIERKIRRREIDEQRQALIDSLRQTTEIKVDNDILENIRLDIKAENNSVGRRAGGASPPPLPGRR